MDIIFLSIWIGEFKRIEGFDHLTYMICILITHLDLQSNKFLSPFMMRSDHIRDSQPQFLTYSSALCSDKHSWSCAAYAPRL